MREIIKTLETWREARNMQDNEFFVEEQVASMTDECTEVLLAKTVEHKAEELCDIAIFAINGLGLLKIEYKAKATKWSGLPSIMRALSNILEENSERMAGVELNYIIKFCENTVNELGYNFKKMMMEKIKVISSRMQDPDQAKDWELNGASGKWKKWELQDKNTIYDANFESCRL